MESQRNLRSETGTPKREKRKPIFNTRCLKKTYSIHKELNLPQEKKQEPEWISAIFLHWCMVILDITKFYSSLRSSKVLIVICIFGNVILTIFGLTKLQFQIIVVIIFSILWFLNLFHCICCVLEILQKCGKTIYCTFILNWRVIISTLCFVMGIIELVYFIDISPLYMIFTISLVVLSCLPYSLCTIIVIVFSFVVFPFLILESIVRLILCRSCETQERAKLYYNAYLYENGKLMANKCSICLSSFEKGESVCILKCHPCHIFHESCILEWVKIKRICPTCKARAKFLQNFLYQRNNNKLIKKSLIYLCSGLLGLSVFFNIDIFLKIEEVIDSLNLKVLKN